jgi:hypothetical protein
MRTARAIGWIGGALGLAAAGYVGLVATAWRGYGRPRPATADEQDPLLDRFMPEFEVVERHHARIAAPAAVTLAAAMEGQLDSSPLVRLIFRTRELVLGAEEDGRRADRPHGLVAETRALGWVVLAERPGSEIVMGAVTQPWRPDVVFRSVPADEFRAFDEPDYVKIVWNLRADPIGASESMFRTETRVTTTDAAARAKFRWYWSRFSPGIALIRRLMLGVLRRDVAERLRRAA